MFEIDPITGLPIIDPITGKPKQKEIAFKNQTQAKAYFEQEKQNQFDNLLGTLGLSKNPLEKGVQIRNEKERFEAETGLSADDYFPSELATPGTVESITTTKSTTNPDEIDKIELIGSKSGLNPMIGSDYDDLLGEEQSTGEQWANGLIKFTGKTALNVAGTLGNMVVGLPAMIADGKFSSFYDNDFMKTMDGLEESMNEALPNYVRKEVEDYNILQQMGTGNFWANDVMGGMSFVAGAILSEYITAGLATPLQLSKAAKALKYIDKADDITKATKYASALSAGDDALRFGRQLLTGTGYEAGLEARHFVNDAKQEYINNYIAQYGKEPNEMEVALAMKDIYEVGNYVFAANAALVSASNMATLPRTFGSKLTNRIAPKLDDASGKVLKYSELDENAIKTLAKKRGTDVPTLKAEIKANPDKTLASHEIWGKGRNVLDYSKNFIKGPMSEMGEELGQSLISDTALEYVTSKFDEDGTEETLSVVEALSQSIADSVGDKDFWKEGLIGLIIGSVGAPNIGRKKGDPYMQGGIWELGNKQEKAQIEALVNKINSNPDLAKLTKEMAIAGVRNAKAVKELDSAATLGDLFRAKNKENEIFYNTAAAWHRAGRIEDFQADTVEAIEKMSDEEFRDSFEYTNMDSSEIKERKQEVVKAAKERIKEVKESMELASRVVDPKDRDLHDAFAFSLSTIKGLDRREVSMAEKTAQKVGTFDSRELLEIARANNRLKLKNNWLITYNNKLNRLKAAKKRLETMQLSTEASESRIKAQQEKVDSYEKEIEILAKEEFENRKSDRSEYKNDFDKFKEDVLNQVEFNEKLEKHYETNMQDKSSIEETLEDLKKIAKYREQLITEYNWLLTKEGSKRFNESVEEWIELLKKERLSEEAVIASVMLKEQKDITQKQVMEYALRNRIISFVNPGVEELPMDNNNPNLPENPTGISQEEANNILSLFQSEVYSGIKIYDDSINDFKERIKKAINDYLLDKNSNKYKTTLNDIKSRIEEVLNSKDSFVAEIMAEQGNPDAWTAELESILKNIKDLLEKESVRGNMKKETSDKTSRPVVLYGEALGMLYPEIFKDKNNNPDFEAAKEYLQTHSIEDIINSMEIGLEYYEKGGELVDTNNPAVKVKLGYGKEKVSAILYAKDSNGNKVKIGGIPDIRRFIINGQPFNPMNISHFEALNSGFTYNDEGTPRLTLQGEIARNSYFKLIELYKALDEKAKEVTETNPVIITDNKILSELHLSRRFNFTENLLNETVNDLGKEAELEFEYESSDSEGLTVMKKFKGLVVVNNSMGVTTVYTKESGSTEWKEGGFGEVKEIFDNTVKRLKAESQFTKDPTGFILLHPEKKKALPKFKGEKTDVVNSIWLLNLRYPKAETSPEVSKEFAVDLAALASKVEEKRQAIRAEYENEDSPIGKIQKEINRIKALEDSDSEFSRMSKKEQISSLTSKINEKKREIMPEIDGLIKDYFIGVTQVIGAIEYSIKSYAKIDTGAYAESSSFVFTLSQYKDPSGNYTKFRDEKGQIKDIKVRLKILSIEDDGITVSLDKEGKSSVKITNAEQLKDIVNERLSSYILKDSANKKFSLPQISSINKVNRQGEIEDLGQMIPNKVLNVFNIDLVDNYKFEEARREERQAEKEAAKQAKQASKPPVTKATGTITTVPKPTDPNKSSTAGGTFTVAPPTQAELAAMSSGDRVLIEAALAKKAAEDAAQSSGQVISEDEKRSLGGELKDILKSISVNEKDGTTNNLIYLDNLKEAEEIKNKIGPDWEAYIPKDINLDDLPPFSFDTSEEQRELAEAVKNLAGILPSNISIKDIAVIANQLQTNGVPAGVVKNAAIYLSKNRAKGIEYHEAFHVVFRHFLNDNQIKMYLSAAKYKYKTPSQTEMNAFKNQVPERALLSDKDLYELWLEEKMADDFMDFMQNPERQKAIEKKNMLERLWEKLKNLIKFFSKKSPEDALENLFSIISKGKYAKAKFVNNRYSKNPTTAFKLLFTEANKLTFEESIRTINTITRNVFTNSAYNTIKEDYELTNLIKEEIVRFKQDYLNVPYSLLPENSPNRVKIRKFQSILENSENISKIVDAVKQQIKYNTLPEQSEDEVTEESKFDNETNERSWEDDFTTVGGFNSLSKKAKNYLSTVSTSYDPFGVLEVLDNSKNEIEEFEYLNWGANPIQLHTALTNLLKNSPKQDYLKRIHLSAKYNPMLRDFYKKFIEDISKEVGFSVDEKTSPEILVKSLVYNSIASAYEKVQAQYATALVDIENGYIKAFKADANDSARKQVGDWENKWISSRRTKAENLSILKQISNLLDTESLINSDKIENNITVIKNAFEALGIKVSYGYIRMSLLQSKIEVIEEKADSSKYFTDLLNEIDSFPDFIGFTLEDISGIETASNQNNNPFEIGTDGIDTASLGRLIKMADYNATFDETVEETTFRNAENKTIYKIIASNYYLSEMNNWRSFNRKQIIKSLFFGELSEPDVSDEARIDALYGMLVKENSFADRTEAETLWLQIKNNSLLKGTQYIQDDSGRLTGTLEESEDAAMEFLDQLDVFIMDGMRKVPMKKEGDVLIEEDYKDTSANTFSKSSTRDKLFMTLSLFGKGESLTEGKHSNFLRKSVTRTVRGKKLSKTREYTLYRTEVIEAKNTQIAVNAPVQQLISGEKTLNSLAVKRFTNALQTELDQVAHVRKISEEIQKGKSTEGLPKDYYFTKGKINGKLVEIFGNEYNLKYRENGSSVIQDVTLEMMQNPNNKIKIPKGEELFQFNTIKDYNPVLYKELLNSQNAILFQDSVQDYFEKVFEEFVEYLTEPEISLIEKKKTTKEVEKTNEAGEKIKVKETEVNLINTGLPGFYKTGNTVNMTNLREFWINDFINSVEISQLVHGPMARLYKDPVDVVKRNARMIASGPTIGFTSTKMKIIPSIKYTDRTDKGISAIEESKLAETDTTDAQVYSHLLYMLNKYLPSLGKNTDEVTEVYKKLIKGYELTSKESMILSKTKTTTRPLKLVGSGRNFYLKCSVASIERSNVSRLVDENEEKALIKESKLRRLQNIQNEYRLGAGKNTYIPSLARILSDELYDKMIAGTISDSEIKLLHSLWKPIPSKEELYNYLNEMESGKYQFTVFDSAIKTENTLGIIEVPDAYIREQVETSNIKSEIIHGTQLMNLIWSEQNDAEKVRLKDVLNPDGTYKEVTLGELRNAYKQQLASRNYKGLEKFIKTIKKKGIINYKTLLELLNESLDISNPDVYMKELLKELQDSNDSELITPLYNLNLGLVVNKVQQMYMSIATKDALKHKVAGGKFTLKSDIGEKVMELENGTILDPKEYKKNPSKYDGKIKLRRLAWRLEKNGDIYTEVKISAQFASQYNLKLGDNIPEHLLELLGVRIPTQDKHSMIYAKVVEFFPPHTGNIIVMPLEVIYLSGADFDIDSLYARMYPIWGNNKKYGYYKTAEEAFEQWKYSIFKSKQGKKALKTLDKVSFKDEEFVVDTEEDLSDLQELIEKIDNLSEQHKIDVLKYLGEPSIFEEFKTKYGDQIEHNKRAYQNGDLAAVNALTKEEIDTILLDIEKKFVYNKSNASINSQPATMDKFNDVREKHKKAGIKDTSKNKSVSDVVSKTKADAANSTGKENIGPAAVFNVIFQRLSERGVELRFGDIFGKTKFVQSDRGVILENGERINDLISTVLSAMTDNAKDPKAAEFNLTYQIISPALLMVGKGVSFDAVMSLTKTPVLLKLGQLITANQDATIKSKFSDLVKTAIKETSLKLEKEDGLELSEEELFTLRDSVNMNLEEYMTAVLQYNLNTKLLPGEERIKTLFETLYGDRAKYAYNAVNEIIGENFYMAKNASDTLIALSQTMGLSKGLKPTFAEDEQLALALKQQGIEINSDKNSDNPLDVKITHTQDFKDDVKKEIYHYDLLEVIDGDPVIKSMVQVREIINNIAKDIFISKSRDVISIFNLFEKNGSSRFFNNANNIKKAKDFILSSVAMMAKRNLQKGLVLPLKYLYEGTYDQQLKRKVGTIEKAIAELKTLPEFTDNLLLNSLRFTSSKVKNKTSPYYGVEIIRINLNIDLKNKPDIQNMLMDSSIQLATSSNPKAVEVLGMLIRYSDMKDGGLFKNKGILKALDPRVGVKTQSQGLTLAHSVLEKLPLKYQPKTGNNTYESVFGMSQKDFYREVLLKFLLNNSNKMAVKYFKAVEAIKNINQYVFTSLGETELSSSLERAFETLKESDITPEQRESIKQFLNKFKPIEFINKEGVTKMKISTFVKATSDKYKDLNKDEKTRLKIAIKNALVKAGFNKDKTTGKIAFPPVINVSYMNYENMEEGEKEGRAEQGLFILKSVTNYTGDSAPVPFNIDEHDFSKNPSILGNVAEYERVTYLGMSDMMATGYTIRELAEDVRGARIQAEKDENSSIPEESVENTQLPSTSDLLTELNKTPESSETSSTVNQSVVNKYNKIVEFLKDYEGEPIQAAKDGNNTGVYFMVNEPQGLTTVESVMKTQPVYALKIENVNLTESDFSHEAATYFPLFNQMIDLGYVFYLPLNIDQASELNKKLC